MKKFKFTIITSTFNCGKEFLETAESILLQNRSDIQWIVIDGLSSKETQDIILGVSNIIDYYLSEVDNGIYDAWNKALPHIKGEWVMFLGAGDRLSSNNVLSNVELLLNSSKFDSKLVFGRINLVDSNKCILKTLGEDWGTMKHKWHNGKKMLPIHPEVFHHKSLFDIFEFDPTFKIAGDSDLLLRIILSGYEPYFINNVITNMVIGGTSQAPQKYKLARYEISKLNTKNKIKVPFFVKHLFSLKLFCKYLIWVLLGELGYQKLRMFIKI